MGPRALRSSCCEGPCLRHLLAVSTCSPVARWMGRITRPNSNPYAMVSTMPRPLSDSASSTEVSLGWSPRSVSVSRRLACCSPDDQMLAMPFDSVSILILGRWPRLGSGSTPVSCPSSSCARVTNCDSWSTGLASPATGSPRLVSADDSTPDFWWRWRPSFRNRYTMAERRSRAFGCGPHTPSSEQLPASCRCFRRPSRI